MFLTQNRWPLRWRRLRTRPVLRWDKVTVGDQSGSHGKGIHRHCERVPLSSAFRGRYLTTSLYHTPNWCLIGIEQDLGKGWTNDADVVQSCLPIYRIKGICSID